MISKLSKLKYSFLFSASLVLMLASTLFFPAILVVASSTGEKSVVCEGQWHGTFHYPNGKNAPFNFEVKGKTTAAAKIYLLNGDDRFEATDLNQEDDSLFVKFGRPDNELVLKIEGTQATDFLRNPDDEVVRVDAVFAQTAGLVR